MQKRRRFRQSKSLEQRLSEEARRLRSEASLLPPSYQREELLRSARRAEAASHLSEWLTSPTLRSPK